LIDALASRRRVVHLGGRQGLGEGVWEMLSDEARRATDIALWKQVRDVVRAAFDAAAFDAVVGDLSAAAGDRITGDAVKVVEVTGKRVGLNEGERSSVLKHLIDGGDLSRYGLHSAITRTAQDVDSYDRATDLERAGGRVIELDTASWRELQAA
jgi:hypothetical protein